MSNDLQIIEVTTIEATLLEELSDLLVAVVEDGASVGFLPPVSKDVARAYWNNVLHSGVILWIVRSNHQLCGTIQLHLAQKENATHRAEVAKLMVAPGQRRKGIGKALLNTGESRARLENRSLLVLDTRLGDPSNILYRSQGYIEAGSIPGYVMSANGDLDATVLYYKQL